MITEDVVPEGSTELLNVNTNLSNVDLGGRDSNSGSVSTLATEPTTLLGLISTSSRSSSGGDGLEGTGVAIGDVEDLCPHLLEEDLLVRSQLADKSGAGSSLDIALCHFCICDVLGCCGEEVEGWRGVGPGVEREGGVSVEE